RATVFVSRRRPHPHPPSFPTRRSSDLVAVVGLEQRGVELAALVAQLSFQHAGSELEIGPRFGAVREQPLALPPGDEEERMVLHLDRKSTRLNSSHVAISYAVFCLKKKS